MRIDFGGGEANKYEGFEKCDILCRNDITYGGIDFECDQLPFKDNSIDDAVCSHTLEHIENTKHFLNELHRVIKQGNKIKFIVPYGLWEGAQKPVHKQIITECWFDFLRKSNSERVYGYKRWDITFMEILKNKEGKNYEIVCDLTPLKSEKLLNK